MLKYISLVIVVAVISSALTVVAANSLGIGEPAVVGGAVGGAVSAVVAVKLAGRVKK